MSDDFGRELRESLQHRADEAHTVDLAGAAVSQAGRIRRRRRAFSGVVVLAVAAIVVPLGAQMIDGTRADRTASRPVDDAPPTRPADVHIGDLSQGPAPTVPYIDGQILHSEDRELALPGTDGQVTDAIALPSGVGAWILNTRTGKTRFESTDPSLGLAPQTDVTAPALNSAQHEAAWVATTADDLTDFVTVDTDTGTAAVTRSLDSQTEVRQVMGFSGGTVLANTTFTYSGRVGSGRFVAEFEISDGDVTSTQHADAIYASAVNADLTRVAGRTRDMKDVPSDCAGMYEAPEFQRLWVSCDWRPVEFSADSSLVLAVSPDADGLGPRELAVMDAKTGDVERVLAADGVFGRATFEGTESVLAVLSEGDRTAIVRCPIDDEGCELATDPATVDEGDPSSLTYPYQLTAN